MEWQIGNVTIPNQVVVAPMAGVTNSAFRVICKKFGAGYVVCEMISDRGIMYHNKKTLSMLKVEPIEHPMGIQILAVQRRLWFKRPNSSMKIPKLM